MKTKNASPKFLPQDGSSLTHDLILKVWVQRMKLKTATSIALAFWTVLEARPWVSSSSIRRVGTSKSNRNLSVKPERAQWSLGKKKGKSLKKGREDSYKTTNQHGLLSQPSNGKVKMHTICKHYYAK